MKDALESAVEDYFLELFRAQPGLKGKNFSVDDSDLAADSKGIVIDAQRGEDLLDGPRGPNGQLRSSVLVTIGFRDTSTRRRERNLTSNAIIDAIKNAGSTPTTAQRKFGRFDIFNERITTDHSHTDNLRIREIKVPVEAGLR